MPRETSAAIGELAGLRRAALLLAAALGGMLVPAAIFVALNAGRGGAAGWAIPMATDIAFAVGVLTLLGSRVPASWRILLLALAVIDDIGAIVVIAVFYTDGVAISGLLTTALGMLLVFALRGVGVRAPAAFLVPGAIIRAGLYGAGVHPTLAGVLVGLATPVRSWFGPSGFPATTKEHLDGLAGNGDQLPLHDRLAAIERARREAISPAERLLHLPPVGGLWGHAAVRARKRRCGARRRGSGRRWLVHLPRHRAASVGAPGWRGGPG
jgi:Na+:H+ antiporter, NhaA family